MWAWKYECSFLDVILRANVIRSKSVYLVSTSVNILLTKYIGCCFSSLFDRTKGQMHTSLDSSVGGAPALTKHVTQVREMVLPRH